MSRREKQNGPRSSTSRTRQNGHLTANAESSVAKPFPIITETRSKSAQRALSASPSTYGLTPRELRREVRRCADAGWLPWELLARFGQEVAS
jgi:hypothetical protein